MVAEEINHPIYNRRQQTAEHIHLFLAEFAAQLIGIQLGNQLREKGDRNRNDQNHGISVQVVGRIGSQRRPRLQPAVNQHTQQDDRHILVGFDAVQHIPQGIAARIALFLRIFQLHIMLLYSGRQGQHHKEENERGNDSDTAHGKADMFTDQRHPYNAGSNRSDAGQYPLCLQEMAALPVVIGQGNDHGIHRHLYQRVGKIIQQIGDHKPYDFRRIGNILRHQEEQHGKNREQKKGSSVPRQIFTLSRQPAQNTAVFDIQLVDQKAEHHIIAGINDLYRQYRRRNAHQINSLKKQEQGHKGRDNVPFQRASQIPDVVVDALPFCGFPAGSVHGGALFFFAACHYRIPFSFSSARIFSIPCFSRSILLKKKAASPNSTAGYKPARTRSISRALSGCDTNAASVLLI